MPKNHFIREVAGFLLHHATPNASEGYSSLLSSTVVFM